jgi:pyruvate formate-lyase activating enzyme-like uncharacterized protein
VIANLKKPRKGSSPPSAWNAMTPAFYHTFFEKQKAILEGAKPDFINCAELHLNPNHLGK